MTFATTSFDFADFDFSNAAHANESETATLRQTCDALERERDELLDLLDREHQEHLETLDLYVAALETHEAVECCSRAEEESFDGETDEFLNAVFLKNEEFMLSEAVLNLASESNESNESKKCEITEMRM